MRADLEDDSWDPLVNEWYTAKAGQQPVRFKFADEALKRQAKCQRVQTGKVEKLNKDLNSSGTALSYLAWFRLVDELKRRGRFTDALRVVDAYPDDKSFLSWLRSEICLLIAQACENPDDATQWYDAAVIAAKANDGLDPDTFCEQIVARALIVKKDFRGALEALDNSEPDATATVVTRLIIEHELDPSRPVITPRWEDGSDPRWRMEFYAACGKHDQLRLEIASALQVKRYCPSDWDWLTSSPFLKSFRESPEGRLLLSSLFLLPEQLATLPIHFDLARLPEAGPVAPASPQSLPTTGSSSGSASSS